MSRSELVRGILGGLGMRISWLIRQARGDKLTCRMHRKQADKQTQVTLRNARLDILLVLKAKAHRSTLFLN